mmetsp:Transcript_28977/g.43779  ORF Transcript_28977/g.43779 Transcript_28977/m.43779 type:complete len:113 (-) Transcript_28977:360-698(-)
MKLILVLRDDALFRDYSHYFEKIPRIEVRQGNIVDIPKDEKCDALVSPASTMGNMDGGIDRVYADYLGWSYGRPYHPPNPLQLAMDQQLGEPNSRLPIGQAVLVQKAIIPYI